MCTRLVRSRADPSLSDLSGLTAFVPASPTCMCLLDARSCSSRTCCVVEDFWMAKLWRCHALTLISLVRCILDLKSAQSCRLSPPADKGLDDGGTGSMCHAASDAAGLVFVGLKSAQTRCVLGAPALLLLMHSLPDGPGPFSLDCEAPSRVHPGLRLHGLTNSQHPRDHYP